MVLKDFIKDPFRRKKERKQKWMIWMNKWMNDWRKKESKEVKINK